MKTLAIIPVILALSGCATGQYTAYAKAQGDIAKYKADADLARFKALSDIAVNGTESARIAAVMAIAMGGTAGAAPAQQVAAPQNESLQWASILVPSLTSLASLHYNFRISESQGTNARDVALSTNATYAAMAGKIQAPQANVTSTDSHATDAHNTTSDALTLSGTGTLGEGSYTTHSTPSTITYPTGNYTAPVVPVPVVPTPVVPVPVPVCTQPGAVGIGPGTAC